MYPRKEKLQRFSTEGQASSPYFEQFKARNVEYLFIDFRRSIIRIHRIHGVVRFVVSWKTMFALISLFVDCVHLVFIISIQLSVY
jgi:hypothetical protein